MGSDHNLYPDDARQTGELLPMEEGAVHSLRAEESPEDEPRYDYTPEEEGEQEEEDGTHRQPALEQDPLEAARRAVGAAFSASETEVPEEVMQGMVGTYKSLQERRSGDIPTA